MPSVPSLKLNTGASIPAIGLGTWQSTGDEVYNAVIAAIKAGYRHIDTAWLYGNEEDVGRAIKDSGVPREELFVTTKLWSTFHNEPETCLDSSLQRMQLDYVDLYLMHWPVALNPNADTKAVPRRADGSRDLYDGWTYVKTWELMQKLPKEKARAIGVSNCSSVALKKIIDAPTTTVTPAVNQVEIHPFLPQENLLKFCKKYDILLEAYCPLGSTGSKILTNEVVVKIAEKYKCSAANVLINWALSRGYVVLPKSVTPSRIEDNLKLVDISADDYAEIFELSKTHKARVVDPDWGVQLWNDED